MRTSSRKDQCFACASASSVVVQVKALNKMQVLGTIGTPANLSSAGSIVFDVKALLDGTTTVDSFDLPVTIQYHYADADIAGVNESSLALYHYHGNAWIALDGCSVDAAANIITCTTPSFSVFALFGQASAAAQASTSTPTRSVTAAVGTHFGCKDPKASNYDYFSASNPSLCKYSAVENASAASVPASAASDAAPAPDARASSAPVASCSARLYPTKVIKFGAKNDKAQVKLLQQYLNAFESAKLPVTGVYSAQDKAAVIAWQEKYADDILSPINLTKGTGYVYKSSLQKFKSLFLAQCQKASIVKKVSRKHRQ